METRACTAFDLSEPSGKKSKCHLYGHKDVVPASGVPGTCYTLFGSALAKKLAVQDEDFLEELETDIEDEVEVELKGWLARSPKLRFFTHGTAWSLFSSCRSSA